MTENYPLTLQKIHRAVERNISEQEIREAGVRAEVIEDYPGDKYSPSGLLPGFTAAGFRPSRAPFQAGRSRSEPILD